MGEVYRARDARLSRDVALKVLPEELSSNEQRLKRFEKEARSASALNHPNIVTVYDIGQSESISYIAMELVEGKTLRDLLVSGALPVRRIRDNLHPSIVGISSEHDASESRQRHRPRASGRGRPDGRQPLRAALRRRRSRPF